MFITKIIFSGDYSLAVSFLKTRSFTRPVRCLKTKTPAESRVSTGGTCIFQKFEPRPRLRHRVFNYPFRRYHLSDESVVIMMTEDKDECDVQICRYVPFLWIITI